MEILDAALNQPLESKEPTMNGIFETAASVSPESTDPARVRSEQFFDPKLTAVDQVLSQEPIKPTEIQPVVTNVDLGPVIDAISKIQTSPNVQVNVESPASNQVTNGAILSSSISDSLANITTTTNNNEESTRLASEYSNEIVTNYKLSQQRNEATLNSLVNLDNYLKTVSSSTTQNQQQNVVNDLQTGITNVLAQRETLVQNEQTTVNETNSTENNSSTVDNAFTSQVSNLTDGSSRVENNSLISQSQINKLVKPQNPVVSSIENLSQEFTRNMTEMNSSLTSSLNNQTSNTTVNDSTVNQFDQSSTINKISEERARLENSSEKPEDKKDTDDLYAALNQNSMYLASIYELLQSGIKVKISY